MRGKQNIVRLVCLSILVAVAALFVAVSSVAAERRPYLPEEHWQAEWVVSSDIPEPAPSNLWIAFRKKITLDEIPASVPCRIACDSKYWLWINGKSVVFEGGLKRGPTPQDTYFDVVDLAPALQKGENTIALLLWYFGKDGFSHKNSGMPGLLVDADSINLKTDASWKATLYSTLEDKKAYQRETADPQPNFRLPESNIRFDARDDFASDWKAAGFDDAAWKNVRALGKPPVAPWNRLYERPIPLFKDFGMHDYVNAADLPKVSDGKPIICKLPYNGHFNPYLKIKAPAGLVIDMRTDNYEGGSAFNVRAEYVTREGEQEYESLGWMNGHTMIYTIPAGVEILALKYRETGYDTEFTGKFSCDDPFYEKLWEKAVRTLYVTMRDSYYDCPDRERAQWWGDAVNELGEAFYALDRKADGLARKGIYELMRWQRPDGVIYSPVPSGNWDRELPLQMLASIGAYGFGTYAFYADDRMPLLETYPQSRRYAALFQFGDDGLVLHRKGAWDWGDWGENVDLRVLTNCWYYLAMKLQRDMAAELAATSSAADQKTAYENDIRDIDGHMRKIRENFDKLFWTGTEYRDPAYKGKTDDRANAMAVVSGLAGPEKYPALRKVFQEQKHASPYMEKYVLEALFQMRFADDALTRMKERYAKMINDPRYTTLWEGWGIGKEGFGGGTINHAWSGGGLTALAQFAVGLAPTKPAFEAFQVLPQMGKFQKMSLTTLTRYGEIAITLDRTRSPFAMTVTVPPGTRATLGFPKEYVSDQKRLSLPPSSDNAHYWLYDFGSGIYRIDTK